jgi:hypothetical protein
MIPRILGVKAMTLGLRMNVLCGLAFLLLSTSSALAQGGELVAAEWGVPGSRVDVTARVRTFLHGGVLRFDVTRFVLGIDPAPHRNKELIIRVRRWNGDVDEYTYPERSSVNLELDPEDGYERHERAERRQGSDDRNEPRLLILRAYYGADGQFMNVTDALRAFIDDGRISVRIDNQSMGGDPLPGRRKWLRILYLYNGERKSLAVEEKADLRLP